MRAFSLVLAFVLIVCMTPCVFAASFTNVIPFAVSSDGSEYIGINGEDGYKSGYRLNSSGNETENAGTAVTGFIPINFGDIICFRDITWPVDSGVSSNKCYLSFYDSSFNLLGFFREIDDASVDLNSGAVVVDSDGNLIKFFSGSSIYSAYLVDMAYFRVSAYEISSDSIITINEEIVDEPVVTEPTETEPVVTEPTESEPAVTVPPVTDPPASDPVPGLDTTADPNGVFALFGVAVAACSNWFVALLDGTGFGGIFLAMIFLMLSYRFLLKPVFGSGGSDKAKKKKEDS